MRILFLNPAYGKGFCKTARWFAKSRARELRHPDYICTAIAVLEEDGHECRFIDGAARHVSADETRVVLRDFDPDAVIINATTPSIYSDLGYARICKEESGGRAITVMIGPHVSAEPEGTLMFGAGALDIAARREYDYTLRDLAQGKKIEEIKGISYFRDNRISHNPDRPFIQELDELPFPSWGHINPRDYHSPAKRNPFLTLITGRGCENRCVFCLFPQVMYGREYRQRSPERVLDEMERDIRLFPNLKEIMFEDDTFTLARHLGRLEKICSGIIERGIRIPWSCNARPDIQDLSILKLMKKSGCRMICSGFESGDEEILANLKKGTAVPDMKRFTGLCREAGISVHGCFVIGGPGETKASVQKTIDLARGLGIDTAQFSGLCPYPGTEFYAWCRDNNYIITKEWEEWVDENREQRAIVGYPELSCADINSAIDRALYGFYLRPGYIASQIMRPKSLVDIKARLRGIFNFVNYKFNRKI